MYWSTGLEEKPIEFGQSARSPLRLREENPQLDEDRRYNGSQSEDVSFHTR